MERYKIGMPRDRGGSMTVFKVKEDDIPTVAAMFEDWEKAIYLSGNHTEFCKEHKVRTKWFCLVEHKNENT